MSRDMYGPMTGPSAWMMTATWDTPYTLLMWAMWAVMMAAMMLPSSTPMLLLYDTVSRSQKSQDVPAGRVWVMAGGYLFVWVLFSAAAVLLQRLLSALLVLSPMMETSSPRAGGILLLVAGTYQFTPLKAVCLGTCRSPLQFVMRHWRTGPGGAFRMGVTHGIYCLGCCWALMLLLFVGGVMNLWIIVSLTLLVLVEKIAPFGPTNARISGAALLVAGIWMVIRA